MFDFAEYNEMDIYVEFRAKHFPIKVQAVRLDRSDIESTAI